MPSAIPDFATVRANPAYNDMSDEEIADSLYEKTHKDHYSDMPLEEFKKALPLDKFKATIGFKKSVDTSKQYSKKPGGEPPQLPWSSVPRLAKESLGKTASDIGYLATHGPETAAAMDAAFAASAKRFGEAPLSTAWGGIKDVAQGAYEGINRGVTTAAGLIGSIPGASLLEEYGPGGDPAALQRHIAAAKENLATAPIGTTADVAGLVPGAALLGGGARGVARTATGAAMADRLLNAGMTPELARRQAQFGGTNLDVLPPEAQRRALSYVATLPRAEVDPARAALERRAKQIGTRHRGDVEQAGLLQPGALLRPGEYQQGVAAQSRALQDQYAEQATRQRDVATRARNRASAERTEAARGERNTLYRSTFAQHADMPLNNYADILKTPAAKKILDDFAADEPSLAAGRGYGIGNLEKLDKLELQLQRDMANFSPGTIAWNTRRELSQAIRDRLAAQFEGVPEMEDYRNARLLHARVANAPEPATMPARRVLMPQPARDALNRLVRNARSTEQFAKKGVAKKLRDEMGADVRAAVPAHLQADIIQGGTNRERAFEELRRAFPKGTEPGTWNAFKRSIITYLGTGGAGGAALLHAAGMPSEIGTGIGVGSALLGGASAIAKRHHKRIGRRVLERTLEELPPPEPYVDVNIPPTLLGRRNP